MAVRSLLETLTALAPVRRLTDAFMGRYAAHRTVQLDRGSAARLQQRTLLRLVQRARHTRFGRDYDFAGIRTVADYQARVPLRSYEAFWAEYWQASFPHLGDVMWPGTIRYFALSSGTSSGITKYIPVSSQMLASNRKAALTMLSLFLAAYPGTPLFRGRLLFLGGSSDLRRLAASPAVWAGDLSGLAVREAPALWRPFTFPPEEMALLADWGEKIQRLAEGSVGLPITMLSGVPSWLLVLFDRLRRLTGRPHIAEVWPQLRLVIHGGTRFDLYRAGFQKLIGDPSVHFLETYPASEGFIAVEDPRCEFSPLPPTNRGVIAGSSSLPNPSIPICSSDSQANWIRLSDDGTQIMPLIAAAIWRWECRKSFPCGPAGSPSGCDAAADSADRTKCRVWTTAEK